MLADRGVLGAAPDASRSPPRHPPGFGGIVQGSSEDRPQDVEQRFVQTMTEIHSVVPGVFALFGFQLIAAFNETFSKELQAAEKGLYIAALVMLAASAAFLMTPASYHRQVRPRSVSDAFANLISSLLAWAMLPLGAVFPIDGYIVTKVVSKSTGAGIVVGAILLAIFAGAWFVGPRAAKRRQDARRSDAKRAGHKLQPA
jgi:hypothetical protein